MTDIKESWTDRAGVYFIGALWALWFFCIIAQFLGRSHAAEDPRWLENDYSPAAQASERIPPACVLGVTNQRFQWMPGPGDLAWHYWEKYRARITPWLEYKALPFMRKWIPVFVQWEQNYQKAKNAIVIVTPVVLKILKKW